METTAPKASILHTVGAIPLALITWAIVSVIASALWYLFNSFMTVIRPEIIGFASNIFGGIYGVVAAKALAEKWLPRHHGKPVAVSFFMFCAFALLVEWVLAPNPQNPILVSAGILATIITAFHFFWQGESA